MQTTHSDHLNRRQLLVAATASTGVLPRLASSATNPGIQLAMIGAFSSPFKAGAEAQFLGSKILFDRLNASGGIAGRQINFTHHDDQFDSKTTIKKIEELSASLRPLALLNLMGPDVIEAVAKDRVLERTNSLVVGVMPATESLKTLGGSRMFHTMASYATQVKKIFEHLSTLGYARVAVLHQASTSGDGVRAAAGTHSSTYKIEVPKTISVPLAGGDFKEYAWQLASSRAQIYLLALTPDSTIAAVRTLRAGGDLTPICTLSDTGAEILAKELGAAMTKGIVISQNLPNPETETTGLTRAYRADLKKFGPPGVPPSNFSLAGYVNAAVTVAALRNASGATSSSQLFGALAQTKVDLGGYSVDFSHNDRWGSNYVNIGVVDRNGRLRY